MARYYVNSFYDYGVNPPIDYVHIGQADAEDEENDGQNWCGSNDAFRFDIYNSLEDAIKNAGFIADKIQFDELTNDEKAEADKIVKRLMSDAKYLAKFGRKLD